MNKKRFSLTNPISHNPIPSWVSIIHDDIEHKHLNAEEICDLLNEQQVTIQELQRKCFELEKDYLIETSDISDKIYLEDEIKKLKKEYGVIDDESD